MVVRPAAPEPVRVQRAEVEERIEEREEEERLRGGPDPRPDLDVPGEQIAGLDFLDLRAAHGRVHGLAPRRRERGRREVRDRWRTCDAVLVWAARDDRDSLEVLDRYGRR